MTSLQSARAPQKRPSMSLLKEKPPSIIIKKVLSPVGSAASIHLAGVAVSTGADTASKAVSSQPYATNPVPSRRRALGPSALANGQLAKGSRLVTGAAKEGHAGTAPGKRKKSTGGLYAKSQSSEHLSGTPRSKKALPRGKQSASQTVLLNSAPRVALPEKGDQAV